MVPVNMDLGQNWVAATIFRCLLNDFDLLKYIGPRLKFWPISDVLIEALHGTTFPTGDLRRWKAEVALSPQGRRVRPVGETSITVEEVWQWETRDDLVVNHHFPC